jgi:hypothetical protein
MVEAEITLLTSLKRVWVPCHREHTTLLIGSQVVPLVGFMTLSQHTAEAQTGRNGSCIWNANGGDTTVINGVARGEFRLHPEGDLQLSDGCIALKFPNEFDALQRYIRLHPADLPVPGSTLKAYGTVDVR